MVYYILHLTIWFIMLAEDGIVNAYAFEPKNRKTPRWKHVLGIMAVECPFMLVKMLSDENILLKNIFLVLMILSVLIYLYIFFDGSLGEKILFRLMCVTACFIAEMVALVIMSEKMKVVSYHEYMHFGNPLLLTLCVYIYIITSILFCLILYVHKKLIRKKQYSPKFLLVYATFPISQILLMLSLNSEIYIKINLKTASVMFGIVGSIFADIFLLYTLLRQQQMQELSRTLYEVEVAWEREKNHYTEIENKRDELAKIRHDLNEQLFVMSELLKNKEYEKVREMLNTLIRYVASTREPIYCADPILNAVMSENEKLCQNKGIQLYYEFDITSPLRLNPVTICSIFSNLLRNAIAAAEVITDKERQKYISVRAKEQGDYVYTEVENSYEKHDRGVRKGYGQEILRSIADQLNGRLDINAENGIYKVCMMVENTAILKNDKK